MVFEHAAREARRGKTWFLGVQRVQKPFVFIGVLNTRRAKRAAGNLLFLDVLL